MPRFVAGWASAHRPNRFVVFLFQYAGRSSAEHKGLFLAGPHMHDDLGLLTALFENICRDMLDHLDVVSAVVLEKVGLDLEENAPGARRRKSYFRIPSEEFKRNGSTRYVCSGAT